MPRRPPPDDRPTRAVRTPVRLSREAIVAAGISVADHEGLAAVSMRRLGQDLGVNPMSLYHHVRDKDTLLEAMVDAVVAEAVDDPEAVAAADLSMAWTDELRTLIGAARRTLLGHPWAAVVLQQRDTPTPATFRHLDRVLGAMRRGGCSVGLAHHALHLLGSRVLGFSQDLFTEGPAEGTREDGDDGEGDAQARAVRGRALAEHYPHVAELALAASHEGGLGGCDDDTEFAFALDVLVDGIERRRLAEGAGS